LLLSAKDHALITKTFAALFVSLLVALASCTGGGSGGGGSGVDDSKTVNNITATEATAICEYGKSPLSEADYKRGVCIFFGLQNGGNAEGCLIAFDQCMESTTGDGFKDCTDAAESVGTLPECASLITVAELEECLYAETALEASDLASISCDTSLDDLPEFKRPFECEKVDELCPSLFGDL
jgi:hypothetical protein